MKPFDDPEASRKLPADVSAFVAEVEAKTKSAMLWGEAEDVVYKDVPALIAIVREQEASAAAVISAAIRLYEGMVEQHNNVSAQNTALRERLAKLETAIDSALDGLYGLSFTPAVFDEIAKEHLDELRRARGT